VTALQQASIAATFPAAAAATAASHTMSPMHIIRCSLLLPLLLFVFLLLLLLLGICTAW
jgi:hypothetical protein